MIGGSNSTSGSTSSSGSRRQHTQRPEPFSSALQLFSVLARESRDRDPASHELEIELWFQDGCRHWTALALAETLKLRRSGRPDLVLGQLRQGTEN